jgi:hypothetical protein
VSSQVWPLVERVPTTAGVDWSAGVQWPSSAEGSSTGDEVADSGCRMAGAGEGDPGGKLLGVEWTLAGVRS